MWLVKARKCRGFNDCGKGSLVSLCFILSLNYHFSAKSVQSNLLNYTH